MSAIADADVSINAAGAIRWTGAATTNRHTILEFIQFMMDKQDDGQVTDSDTLLDITVDTPFDRSTDDIVTLNSPFNIDDTFALHLYGGSVSQIEPVTGGETLYSGLSVIGPVESGTEYMIIQDGSVLPAFWGSGINAEASPSLVFSRHLIKSKKSGCDIDGKRITVLARELGDQFRRFPVTLGTGSSVAAIGNGADIFNTTTDATLASYTTIVNTEGFQELDIDGSGASGQEFYSQWDIGSQTINDTYERTKWISQRAHQTDITGGAPTGADFVIDNATIVGQGQSFIPLSGSEKIVEVRAKIKILAGTPTGPIYCELWDSDDVGSQLAEPTGGALARSENVLASSITSSYETVIFRFNRRDPSDGTVQLAGLTLGNVEYFAVFRHLTGTAGDNFSLEGASTDQDSTMNQADDTAAVWTASATDDIFIEVKSCPVIHDIPGEIFQGINVEVGFDGEIGAGIIEDDIIMWGTKITYDALVSGPFRPGEYITIKTGSTLKSGAKVLFDDGVDEIIVALDTLSAIADDDVISTVRGASETTATINVTIVDNDKSGGEAILLAKDDNGAIGEVYLNVVSGVNPVDNNIMRTDNVTADPLLDSAVATTTINTRTLSPEYVGTSTGSNIIGSYGIGFQPADVGSNDRFRSLDDASRIPPNNVTFTVSGLVSGEDRVLVGPRTGSTLNKAQLQTDTTLSGATETLIQCSAAIPAGTPTSGTGADNTRVRVKLDTGIYRRVQYDSFSGNDFTITVGPDDDWTGANVSTQPKDVFVAYIDVLADSDTESYTAIHTINVDVLVRVRDGGATPIKTFEAQSAQFLATPVTVAAVRTSDA